MFRLTEFPLPMWPEENRARYDRKGLRNPSDLTDAEWGHVEPLIPPAKRGGDSLGFRSANIHAERLAAASPLTPTAMITATETIRPA